MGAQSSGRRGGAESSQELSAVQILDFGFHLMSSLLQKYTVLQRKTIFGKSFSNSGILLTQAKIVKMR